MGVLILYLIFNISDDCNTFIDGGADLITSTISPDGSGSATYQPMIPQGCYQLVLDCYDTCTKYSDKIELDSCCTSSLAIDETDCVISVTNIPCTGSFTYNVYANGTLVETGGNTTDFTVSADQSAIYQVEIVCDGCSYYSNVITANCDPTECQTQPLLNVSECKLTAIVENCDNPQIQWQENISGVWTDISGATGMTYDIVADGTFRYVLTGCDCVNEPLISVSYSSDCFVECNCDIQMSVDGECKINSDDVGCDLILNISWYYEESPGVWQLLPQFNGMNIITPNLDGTYKKVIKTKDCGEEEAQINVTCVDECVDMNITLDEHVECTIIVSWSGCYELNSAEWTFAPSTGNVNDCGNGSNTQPANYIVVSPLTTNELEGTGTMEIKPLDDGCYTFTINCNDDCDASISTEFEACCSPNAQIVVADSTDQLCDYCFFNEDTEELIEIYVEIDGVQTPLSSFDGFFNFPYCDDAGGTQPCDPSLPSFVDLVNDINAWLTAYGYEGTALNGNGNGTCKGLNTPFWIQQSNIVFDFSYLYEDIAGYQNHPFLKDNCTEDSGGDPVLEVVNACEGASYLWSTGATTQSIHFQEGQKLFCDGYLSRWLYGSINVYRKCWWLVVFE